MDNIVVACFLTHSVHTLCPKKRPPLYLLNNSVKN